MEEKNKYGSDFWNLSKILDERKALFESSEPKPSPAPIQIGEEKRKTEERKINLSRVDDRFFKPEEKNTGEYSREKIRESAPEIKEKKQADFLRPLILSVELSPVNGGTRNFTRHAEKYFNLEGEECSYVDFYSFSPTYANLTLESFNYYLWWRSNFRKGNSIKANWSYLSLYISELLNCTSLISEDEAIEKLWRLFVSYADVNSNNYISDALSKLPEIICDYSLIHSKRIPAFVPREFILLAVNNARLREVFFEGEDEDLLAELLISTCSEYDLSKSKFLDPLKTEENSKLLRKALVFSMHKARETGFDHPLSGEIKEVTTVTRHSYSSFVYVDPQNLRLITVGFCSVNRSYTLRNSISGIVKQCENNIRLVNGIKPRLKVFSLEVLFRDSVDAFFNAAFPPSKRKKPESKAKKEEIPEYEKLYEHQEKKEFSLEQAKKIEERSWNIVKKLTEEEEETEESSPCKSPADNTEEETVPALNDGISEELSSLFAACPCEKDFILAVFSENPLEIHKAVAESGIPLSVLADTVNAAAFDIIGDILIEYTERSAEIIEDYKYIFDKNI